MKLFLAVRHPIQPQAQQRSCLSRQAVTLIETIIVMLVLAITAVAATPRLSQALQGYRVQTAAQRLLADLEMVRSYARTTGQDVTIDFDFANHRYTVEGLRSLDQRGSDYIVELSTAPYYSQIKLDALNAGSESQVTTPVGGEEHGQPQATNLEIVYDRFEQVSLGASIGLMSGGQIQVVTIDPDSGEAQLQ